MFTVSDPYHNVTTYTMWSVKLRITGCCRFNATSDLFIPT